MIRIKLFEAHSRTAKILKEEVKRERNKKSERGDNRRKHHYISLKPTSDKYFSHVWLNIPERDLHDKSKKVST